VGQTKAGFDIEQTLGKQANTLVSF